MNDTPTQPNFSEEYELYRRRRDLLPWWIKFFCWLFMFFGFLAVICLLAGFTNFKPALSFYGLETNEPFSVIGLSVIFIGMLKGFAAFALWFEKDYAIKLAKADAILGTIICIVITFASGSLLNQPGFNFRLEILFLIPYLIKINNIEDEWDSIRT